MAGEYITEEYIKKLLVEVCNSLNCKVPKIYFLADEFFIRALCKLPIVKEIMEYGVYKNFYAEYASFAAMGQGVIIFSLDRANKFLKGFSEYQIQEYLKYVLGHEVGHIIDWHDDPLKNEELANSYAKKVADVDAYEQVSRVIWEPIYDELEKGGD